VVSVEERAAYYDSAVDRFMAGYLERDSRVVEAVRFAGEALAGCHRLLDVGCGIGWASASVAERVGADVVGVDVSPAMVAMARSMFGGEQAGGGRCWFATADFARRRLNSRYDGAMLLDVYEHFTLSERPRVHAQIRRAVFGPVVVAVPTPAALDVLRARGIALQPVDEDVSAVDLEVFASEAGGRLIECHVVEVDGLDYRHALIEVSGWR
jgi:SAM-dependent methyltransferase